MPNTKPFAYFGTPAVASETLALLIEAGFVPRVVVSSPDAPKGRGLVLTPSPTKTLALSHGIPVLTPEKLDEFFLSSFEGCEYAVVVAYGKILPQAFIDAFPLGVLNIHYSLLPKYRGASPVEAALLNNEEETGVTIQRMVFKLDAGDILAQSKVSIKDTDTVCDLRPRLITEGAELLLETLPAFERGELTATPQDESLATHVGKIKKEEGRLEIPGDDPSNWLKYSAFKESPGTYFFASKNGVPLRVKIVEARFVDGTFVIERVVPEGKKEMSYEDFTRALHA